MPTSRTVAVLLALALAGCAVGPDYVRPNMPVPAHFKEAQDWQPAAPADAAARGAWWLAFGADELDRLEQQAAAANQNVRVAEARYRQALAVARQARAALFPNVAAGASVTRSKNGASGAVTLPPSTTEVLSLSAAWELDLWGGIRRSTESAQASAQASAAQLGAAVLSLQAELATDYLALRVADEQKRLLDEAVGAYQRSLELTESRYRGGVAARSDVAQAQAQLEGTRAQAIDVGIQRAQLEHAIATLLGSAPADFSLEHRPYDLVAPAVPPALPSSLLQRRPDVAAAERQAAAANAQIGVAQAAFFPTLTLSASGGYRAPSGADLLAAPNRFWSLGPALAQTLFDAGARSAAKEQALAAYDAAAASYRAAVLTALQDVEDNLAALRLLGEEAAVQDAAVAAAEESLRLTTNQYKAGTVSYLNVITAQTTALSDRRAALDIRGRELAASVALIKALGGDWNAGLPAPAAATDATSVARTR